MRVMLIAILAALAVSGCGTNGSQGPAMNFPVTPTVTGPGPDYEIGPRDTLSITVFQVPDLTVKEAKVDASGLLALPLIGSVTAAGKTTVQLADEIAAKLKAGYLQSPQVSVIVLEAIGQKVTVDGAVTEPGVFELKGRTTLLQAVAMAKGPGRDANLRRVAVFRVADGQRTAAVFDLSAIRDGRADDPQILANDVIVVDSSALKGVMREIISALPGLAVFRSY